MNEEGRTEVRLKRFAWMGISFLIPENWSLGKYEGTFDEGTLRIDDLEQERMTVMWKRVKASDPDRVVQKHLKEAQKQAKKQKLPFESKRGLRRLPRDGEMFWWKSDMQAYNICMIEDRERPRVVFIRLLARADEEMKSYANVLCDSLKADDGQKQFRWAVFGLDVRLPREMIPNEFSFKTGCIRLGFEQKRESLVIEKMAPANVVMQGLSLFDWLQRARRKELEIYSFTGDEEEIQGHEAAFFTGKAKKRWNRGCNRFDLWGWVCDKENRLYAVFHQYRKEARMEFDVSKIACHERPGDAATKTVEMVSSRVSIPDSMALKRKKGVSREKAFSAVPVRNEAVEWKDSGDQIEITFPIRFRMFGKFFERLFRTKQGKKITLDEMGAFVWRSIDGKRPVRELVDMLVQEYKLERVESHAALMTFLQSMMKKRLIGMYLPDKDEEATGADDTK